MKNLFWLVCLAIVSFSSVAAQDTQLHAPQADNNFFVPHPEAQAQHESSYQRFETPQELVFRNAALRGAQRRERMAINARFGYSPSRPPASTLPFMGSPTPFRVYSTYPGFLLLRP